MSKVNLEVARRIIEAAEKKAEELKVSMVISVVDEGGNLIATHRMDDAWIASLDVAPNKAWTAVALKTRTEGLAEATVPSASLYGLNTTNQGRIVVFGGGIPLESNGKVIGAVGVSGSSVDHDIQVAEAAEAAFRELTFA